MLRPVNNVVDDSDIHRANNFLRNIVMVSMLQKYIQQPRPYAQGSLHAQSHDLFLVCAVGYQVEWNGGRREGFHRLDSEPDCRPC